MNGKQSGGPSVWGEFFFTLVLLGTVLALLSQGLTAQIDERGTVNARSFPVTLTGLIGIYAFCMALALFRKAAGQRIPRVRLDGMSARVIMPLTASMFAYVWIVEAVGYIVGTALIMAVVLWLFEVRRMVLNAAISVGSALSAQFIFVKMLGMYMPEGWLLAKVMEWFSSP